MTLNLIPYFSIETINIGFLPIKIWGLFVALGFAAGLIMAIHLAKKKNINSELIYEIAIYIFIGSIAGARIFYVFLFWDDFANNLFDIFKIWQGGMVYYGGFIGGVLAALLFIKIKKLEIGKFADIVAISLPLGLCIGRIGCFLINDHPGSITRLFFGISWPDGSIRHPVALYLILANFVTFLILYLIQNKIRKSGILFIIFLILYSLFRFFLDFTRAYDLPFSDPRFSGLTISQIFSITLFIIGLVLLLRQKYNKINQVSKNEDL